MIQGVELLFGHQRQQVRKLEGRYARRFEQCGKALEKIIDVRDMGQHIVGRHQVRRPTVVAQLTGTVAAEKHFANVQALFPGGLGGAAGWLDTQARDFALGEVLQQVAVVGSDLHDPAVPVEAKTLDHLGNIAPGMGQPGTGVGTEIGIVGVEQAFGTRVVFGLHQPALLANHHLQRDPLLGLFQLFGAQVGIGWRCAAQVDQGQAKAGSTASAVHGHTPAKC
ncbi:hypothetical protein D9M71_308340 [compost metagenome]